MRRYVKVPAHRNGLLCRHGAVIPVVEAQPMPVHGRLEIAAIGDVHDQGRSLLNPEVGPGIEPL